VVEFGVLTNSGGASRREAISTLARRYNRPARQVYQIIERAKSSV
jgi:Mor family transcriptional regulator